MNEMQHFADEEARAMGRFLGEVESALRECGVPFTSIGAREDGLLLVETGGEFHSAWLSDEQAEEPRHLLGAVRRMKLDWRAATFEDRVMTLFRSGYGDWLRGRNKGVAVPLTTLRIARKMEAELAPAAAALAGLVQRGFIRADGSGGYQLDHPYLTESEMAEWEEESSARFLADTRADAAEYQRTVDPDFHVPGLRLEAHEVGGRLGERYDARRHGAGDEARWRVWDCWENEAVRCAVTATENEALARGEARRLNNGRGL